MWSSRSRRDITVSGPAVVAVDLHDHQIGSPIPANVRFLVSANAQEVELQVACTDLYKAGDPTSAHRIPVAGAGARITCEHGHAVAGGDALLPWQRGLRPVSCPPAGRPVTEAATFTASPAATFSQNVAVEVSWNATDPDLPLGGIPRLRETHRPDPAVVGNQANFLREIYQLLKSSDSMLLTEPIKHVSRTEFDRTVSLAQQEGFLVTGHPPIRLSQTVVLTKPSQSR